MFGLVFTSNVDAQKRIGGAAIGSPTDVMLTEVRTTS